MGTARARNLFATCTQPRAKEARGASEGLAMSSWSFYAKGESGLVKIDPMD